ncbi:PREDICTED: uncharacterized protein LOC104817668 [Tarenaya hassleriana]|uniref:uncharacterized protein LOC104817668 n=1 Tax=Tarenaya hassleriana TaxID=28532 RepID=UPI00053C3C95|nr:PREDICTED: uncharacterized protein LOC104817668 [Tarenaya hassleriana]
MKSVSRTPVRRNDGGCFHRYLKPGVLAQIRDSRINARSNSLVTRSSAQRLDSSMPSPGSPSRATPQILTIDHVPDLLCKIYGPCSLRRKKLVAARSMSLMDLNAASSTLLESVGGNSSVLNNDALVSH